MSSQDKNDHQPAKADNQSDNNLSNVYQQMLDEIATVKTIWTEAKQIEGKIFKKFLKIARKSPIKNHFIFLYRKTGQSHG